VALVLQQLASTWAETGCGWAWSVVVCNDMEAAAKGEMGRGVLRQFKWAIFDTIIHGLGRQPDTRRQTRGWRTGSRER
jgi:hypothetical protein